MDFTLTSLIKLCYVRERIKRIWWPMNTQQFLWTTVLKELEDYIYCERVFTQLFHCTRVRERKARWKFSFVLIASSSAWNWKCENEKKFVCAFPATFPSLFLFLNCAHHTRWSSIKNNIFVKFTRNFALKMELK